MRGKKWLPAVTALVTIFVVGGWQIGACGEADSRAKYVFLFIGDGMGIAQRNSAEIYLAREKGLSRPEGAKLVMNTFPAQGMDTTYDLTSVIPDSASTATAMASGHKTSSGTIGMDTEAKISYENIAEAAKKKNWKVAILSTVSLDHATPAAFYAHVASRRQMYDISMQLANSGFDYFAGGQLLEPVDKKDPAKPNAIETAKKNGYTVAVGREEFQALKPGLGKVIAMNKIVDRDAAMYYTLDQRDSKDHVTLAEYLSKGIELLDNPNGFFMMVEGGKIDWACHANDAASSIRDTLALDEAVARAVSFYEKHPTETLIVVTGDHETGGMTIGFAGTQYSSFMDKIQYQKMSYIEFDKKLAEYKKAHTPAEADLEDLMPLIREAFGLYVMPADERSALQQAILQGKAEDASEDMKKAGKQAETKLKYGMALSELELKALQDAFKQSMLGEKERARDDYTYLLYGGYEPLSVKLTTILNNKAGLGWTSYSHTGVPVQTSAIGADARLFNGYYDQTDIYTKLMKITGLQM
ncbi:MAG: alkaline phosphatase [Syntrophobacteraceae bacterium]|jgi:alkaline phosphatase